MTPPADVVGKLVEIARRLQLENPAPPRRRARSPAVLDKQVLSDILECCLTPAYQVAWREGNSVLHREFKEQDDAAAFYESLGSTSRKRLTSHGREVCVSGLEGRGGWPLEWVPDHPSAYRHLQDFLSAEDMARLGGLGRRARVKLDASMSDTAHGRAERCPHTSIPLCRINPKTPDVRYVILHELMHHQLNELGCPAIICPQLSRQHNGSLSLGSTLVPPDSWLQHIDTAVDPDFVPDLVTTLWELIQHARFNGFLMSQFGCGPQSARDLTVSALFSGDSNFPYCNPKDRLPVRRVMLSLHYATARLESSPRACCELERFFGTQGDEGKRIVELGSRVAEQVSRVHKNVCRMSCHEAEALVAGMLLDLEASVQVLLGPLRVLVGQPEQLKDLWQKSCRTSCRLSVLPA